MSVQLVDPAWIAAVRSCAADGIGRINADRQVDVGAVRTECIVPRQAQFRTCLPPAMPGCNNAISQRLIEPGPRARPPVWRRNCQPIALTNGIGLGGQWVEFRNRVRLDPP